MKTTGIEIPAALRCLLSLLFLSLIVACGNSTDDTEALGRDVVIREFADSISLADRVQEVIRQSDASVIEAIVSIGDDGHATTGLVRRPPPPPDLQPGQRLNLPIAYIPPIGTEVASFDDPPSAMVVTDSGDIIVGDGKATRLLSGTTTILHRQSAQHLQLDAQGTRLILQADGETYILSGADWKTKTPITGGVGSAGWMGDGRIVFVRQNILDFRAVAAERVSLSVTTYDPATNKWLRPQWPVNELAGMGTLPAIDAMWVHRARPFQINPMPAPLLAFANNSIGEPIIPPSEAADITPAAARYGTLVWIRTYRHGGLSARAFVRNDTHTLQLTNLTTGAVSISPSGEHIVYTVTEVGHAKVYRVASADLNSHTETLARFAEQDQILREQASALSRALEQDLRAVAKLTDTQFGTQLEAPPTMQLVQTMADAFRRRAEEISAIRFSKGYPLAEELDQFFNYVGDYMTEDPWTVLALAGLIEASFPPSDWTLDQAGETLSIDVRETTLSDDLTFNAILVFGMARERISGRLSVADVARRLHRDPALPIHLVENFSEATLETIQIAEAEKAGIPEAELTLGRLTDHLRENPLPNNAFGVFAYATGRNHDHHELQLISAIRLAESAPWSAEAMETLGEALLISQFNEEALLAYAQAIKLDPDDIAARLSYADLMLSLDRHDEALEEYRLIGKMDREGIYEEHLATRLKLVEEFRAKATE